MEEIETQEDDDEDDFMLGQMLSRNLCDSNMPDGLKRRRLTFLKSQIMRVEEEYKQD